MLRSKISGRAGRSVLPRFTYKKPFDISIQTQPLPNLTPAPLPLWCWTLFGMVLLTPARPPLPASPRPRTGFRLHISDPWPI